MTMSRILQHYDNLLKVYTDEVTLFEKQKEEFNKVEGSNKDVSSPHSVINHRMFHFDEWLTNPFHNYFCYEQKKKILPLLIRFISEFNQLTNDEKEIFEKSRIKDKYQEFLDELWKPKLDFLKFLDLLKKERDEHKLTFRYPPKPSRSNAHRQLAEFEKKKTDYWKDMDSNENCIKEIAEWKKIYEFEEK
jgi:hypothetical protein